LSARFSFKLLPGFLPFGFFGDLSPIGVLPQSARPAERILVAAPYNRVPRRP
jgi:hypothetical protein